MGAVESCMARCKREPRRVRKSKSVVPMYNPGPYISDLDPEVYTWRYRVVEHEPLLVAFYALNVAAWDIEPTQGSECFLTWDILNELYSFFQVEPQLTFQKSGTSVFEPRPEADGCYETDLSVESISNPQQYIAMRFEINKCIHDVTLVNASYNTARQIIATKTVPRFPRIQTSGTYVLCVCSEHGQAALMNYEAETLDLWPAPGVRVEAPQHVAVSIFGYGEKSRERKRAGEKGTNVRVEFVQLPADFREPDHHKDRCFVKESNN